MESVFNEDTYDEINTELREINARALAQEEAEAERINIGSGEDVFSFNLFIYVRGDVRDAAAIHQ
jgi:hypothetical protein